MDVMLYNLVIRSPVIFSCFFTLQFNVLTMKLKHHCGLYTCSTGDISQILLLDVLLLDHRGVTQQHGGQNKVQEIWIRELLFLVF